MKPLCVSECTLTSPLRPADAYWPAEVLGFARSREFDDWQAAQHAIVRDVRREFPLLAAQKYISVSADVAMVSRYLSVALRADNTLPTI